MITSDKIETKVNTYNYIRNFCINNMNDSNDLYEQKCYLDIISLIDAKMKKDNVEHYVYYVNL